MAKNRLVTSVSRAPAAASPIAEMDLRAAAHVMPDRIPRELATPGGGFATHFDSPAHYEGTKDETAALLIVAIDDAAIRSHADVISTADSRVAVRIMRTDEEASIAPHCIKVLRPDGASMCG